MENTTFSILSWNVNGEGGISDETVDDQLDFLRERASDVDVFLFQAVNYEQVDTEEWGGQLRALHRYFAPQDYDVVHTADWAAELFESEVQPQQDIHGPHDRCNVTASRWPIERTPLSLRDKGEGYPRKLSLYASSFPEKLLVSEIDVSEEGSYGSSGITVWNVGIIHGAGWGEEKLKMLETVYSRIYVQNTKTGKPLILGGDFNAPKMEEPDEITPHGKNKPRYTNYPFYGDPYYFGESAGSGDEFSFKDRWRRAERNIFDSDVSEWAMTDAYRTPEASPRTSSEEDYTHIIPSATPSRKRLDHIFLSDQFTVKHCEIWNGEGNMLDGHNPSDHAPVFAEVQITE